MRSVLSSLFIRPRRDHVPRRRHDPITTSLTCACVSCFESSWPATDTATGAPALLGEHGCAVGGDTVFSDLTCTNYNNNDGSAPRKRARVGDAGLIMDLAGQHDLLPPVPAPLAFAPAGYEQSRVLCSGAASTSGGPAGAASASRRLLSHLHRHGVEVDAIVRVEAERLRAGLQDARRRYARAVLSAAARRLRAAEAGLARAAARNAELDERLRQTAVEAQAWQGVARSHEAAAAGLRAALDDLARSPCTEGEGGGDADDARSCCFEQEEAEEQAAHRRRARACRSCGGAEACVLLLPCRHLCLCGVCDAAVEACPVCAAAKNASLHVLLS